MCGCMNEDFMWVYMIWILLHVNLISVTYFVIIFSQLAAMPHQGISELLITHRKRLPLRLVE